MFHLEKLESAGLVVKDPIGNYRTKTRIKVGLVRNFIFIRGALIPKHIFYAAVTTTVSILYFMMLRQFLSTPIAMAALLLNAASAGVFWYESWQDWKLKPRFS